MELQKIDTYLHSGLPEKDRLEFEDLIMHDANLAQEVQQYESIIEGIKDYERDRLKKRLQDLEGSKYGSTNEFNSGKRSYTKLSLAGAFFLLAITSFLLPTKNAEEIFQTYFETYPNTIYLQQDSSFEASSYNKAFEFYTDGKFEKSAQLFKQLERNGTDRIGIPFYLAMSYMHQGKNDLAIPKFFTLSQMEEHDFSEPVYWYLSLALIKEKEFKAAKIQLEKLVTYNNPYQKKAIKLIKRL